MSAEVDSAGRRLVDALLRAVEEEQRHDPGDMDYADLFDARVARSHAAREAYERGMNVSTVGWQPDSGTAGTLPGMTPLGVAPLGVPRSLQERLTDLVVMLGEITRDLRVLRGCAEPVPDLPTGLPTGVVGLVGVAEAEVREIQVHVTWIKETVGPL